MSRRLLIMVASFAVLFSACARENPAGRVEFDGSGKAKDPATQTAPAQEPKTQGSQGPPVVPEMLQFTAPLVGGGQVRGSDLAGKDVAAWFWAPW